MQEEIFSGVKWLVHSQNKDGSWNINGVPKNRIWAVHDAILAIKTFLDKTVSIHLIDQMIRIDNILILTKPRDNNALVRTISISVITLLLIGLTIGITISTITNINMYLSPWLHMYWAWVLFGIYVFSVYPLIKL